MKSLIAAALALFLLFPVFASAQNMAEVPIPEDVVQTALNNRLPFTARNGKTIEITFIPGSVIHFRADGNIDIDGIFRISFNNKTFYEGELHATADLRYDPPTSAFYLSRAALKPNGLTGNYVRSTEPRTRIGKIWADARDARLEDLINKPNFVRSLAEDQLRKWLEDHPIYRLDGTKPWHSAIATVLNEGRGEVLVREKTLLLRQIR